MTVDLKIRWDSDLLEGDFTFEDNDFETDDGLATAVLISWFTDQRISDEDVIPNKSGDFIDKRGWWGDLVDPVVEGDQIGSKLWLLNRAKNTTENIALGIEYGTEALQWMIDDGAVKEIEVTGEAQKINNQDYLVLKAVIIKLDGNELNISFDPEWYTTLSSSYN